MMSLGLFIGWNWWERLGYSFGYKDDIGYGLGHFTYKGLIGGVNWSLADIAGEQNSGFKK